MKAQWDLAVVGIGNMGVSVLGALLAKGRRGLAIDLDRRKVDALAAGRSVVPEAGASVLFARAAAEGRLQATTSLARVAEASCVFIAVQTPAHDDQCDYTVLQRLLRDLADCAGREQPLVVGSTVFPGGIRRHLLPELASRPDLALVYEPVFLRAGFGIEDYIKPGKFLFGVEDPIHPPEQVKALFGSVVEAEPRYVTWEEAEWIKMVHNAWMGVKICFANEIDQLCRAYGADTRRVLRTAFEENAWGRLMTLSHMMPGPPYSGPCLPKDAAVLGGLVAEHAPEWMQSEGICHALRRSNERFVEALVDEWLGWGRESGKPLGIIGTSFRPDFNEMRFSLALPFIRRAQNEGLAVLGYDPTFEGLGLEEYLLACRGDKALEGLYETIRYPLEMVWSRAGVVLLNRRLSSAELERVKGLACPYVVDLYQNELRAAVDGTPPHPAVSARSPARQA
jgi:nucleotide sugar dehydrogenase